MWGRRRHLGSDEIQLPGFLSPKNSLAVTPQHVRTAALQQLSLGKTLGRRVGGGHLSRVEWSRVE